MKVQACIVALFALLGLTSAQVCTPVATCSAALSAVPIPPTWYSLNFSTDPRPSNAVYNWSSTGANETGCSSSAFHQGVVQFAGVNHDSTTLGPSINLTAPFSQPNSVSTPLPTAVFFGVGTSLGSVQAGTAGWSIELTFKSLAITSWGKIMDFTADGLGVPNGTSSRYDVLLGWQSANNNLVWTTYGPNGGTGFASDIFPLANAVLGQWYHAVLSYQETAAGLANYYAYVNGALVGTLTNVYFPPAASRASANLARSGWADAFWVGEMDTFNIYQHALTATQAAALSARAMGGCAITPQSASPVNTTTAAPTPFFDASFTTDPRSAAGGTSAANYGWVASDADDATCGLSTHTGLLQVKGQYESSPAGQYANLSAASGPMSVGQVLPTIGGQSAGIGEAAGWSFEVTFKAQIAYRWAKIFDIAAPQNTSRSAPCQHDIIVGFQGDTVSRQPIMQFDVCNGVGGETSFSWGTVQLGTWYHLIVTVQQLPLQPTQAVYTAYVNGVRAGVSGVANYPEAVVRANGQMGKSSWADSYWGGFIDSIRVYNQSLSGAQASGLYVAAMGASGTQRCPVIASSALSSDVPADSVSYSLTFSSDPSAAAGGAGSALYSWMASDANDTAADRSIHQGLLLLGGSTSTTLGATLGPYVNLSAPSGPASVGQVLPLVGTSLNGQWSRGSVGFSVELVIKMRSQTNWAKVMDLGGVRSTAGGTCNGDLVLGWFANTVQLDFESCLDNGASSGHMGLPNTTTLNQWLHIVVVVQQNYTNTATAFGYVNGQRVASLSLPYPFAQQRRDATLGRSLWNDQYINAVYDLFQVYNIALNPAQVATRYAASLAPPAAPTSSSSSAAAPSVSSGSSSSAVVRPTSSSSSSAAGSASAGSSSSAMVQASSASASSGARSSSSSSATVPAAPSSSSAPSSSAAPPAARSSSSSSSSSTTSAVLVSSSSSSISSAAASTATARVSSSSSSSSAPLPSSVTSSTAIVDDGSSSSSTASEQPSFPSSSTAQPPIAASGARATSTLASAAVLTVCVVASLALML